MNENPKTSENRKPLTEKGYLFEWNKNKKKNVQLKKKLKRLLDKINYPNLIIKEHKNNCGRTFIWNGKREEYSFIDGYDFYKKKNIFPLASLRNKVGEIVFEFNWAFLGIDYSLYYYSKQDNEFMKRWKEYRSEQKRRKKKCDFCDKIFTDKDIIHLHHKTDWREGVLGKKRKIEDDVFRGRLSILDGFELLEKIEKDIIKNYKSFKNTVLICNKCHFLAHKDSILNGVEKRKNLI